MPLLLCILFRSISEQGVDCMFLKWLGKAVTYEKLEDKIRKDLMSTLQKRGVRVSGVKIDMKPDNLNVSVCLNER